jgi:hypothetical protein
MPLLGGGLVQKAPEDGTWIKYHLNWKLEGPDAESSEGEGSWTVRFVGTSMEDGRKHRWIEFEEILELDGRRVTNQLEKYLVAEENLAPGKDALPFARARWRRISDANRTFVKIPGPLQVNHDMWKFLPGLTDRVQQVSEPREILYQAGKLTCDFAVKHQKRFQYADNDYTVNLTLWQHDRVPCGGAAALIETARFDKEGNHKVTWMRELSMTDFGTGAESRLTD